MIPFIVTRKKIEQNVYSLGYARKIFQSIKIGKIFYWLLLFIPVSIFFGLYTPYKTITFITSILAIIPLARILGYSTKEISLQTNPTVSGLFSATFGNAIELIIAVLALR